MKQLEKAATDLGCHHASVAEVISGRKNNVYGFTFKRIGE
jgi:hypothetical protein